MNEFPDIENQLRKLRPSAPSANLLSRVEHRLGEMAGEPENIISPRRFQVNWRALGLGLAVAATLVILARINFQTRTPSRPPVAATTGSIPQKTVAPATDYRAADYRAAGLTQVVYSRRDEGLVWPRDGNQPARRLRTEKRETLRWHNPATGAELEVSYPTSEIALVPISGQ